MKASIFAFCVVIALASGSASAQTQMQMNQDAAASYHRADAELNDKYRQVLQRAGDHAAKFRAAQRAWLAFRDSECDFAASGVEGGSAYPMIYVQCLEGLTRTRIKDFDSYLACQEGDLSCPTAQ